MSDESWIDDSVTLDFTIPSILQEIVDACEQHDRDRDYRYFDDIDDLWVWAKNLCVAGEITKSQWETLERRYMSSV